MARKFYNIPDPQIEGLFREIFGNISFGAPLDKRKAGNFSAQFCVFTTANADVEFTVTHDLERVPTGYLVFLQDKPGTLYYTSKNETQINFKFSVSNTASVTIILF